MPLSRTQTLPASGHSSTAGGPSGSEAGNQAAALRVASADELEWDDTADVVVVGLGGAGACAALGAREEGADVIAIDRFEGGGATALSGGVYYGGGTAFQQEAGFPDTPEQMFNYLRIEVRDAVRESTLRRFCEQSAANLQWLISHGVRFSGKLNANDQEYMAPGYYLYFSGNERVRRYADVAQPAPRGHIALGSRPSPGQNFFAPLREAVDRAGVRSYLHSPVSRLVVDASNRVVGVEMMQLEEGSAALRRHRRYLNLFNMGKGILYGVPARFLSRRLAAAEQAGTRKLIRARRAVVLSTGGFIHNRDMVARYLPRHVEAVTLGGPGCTGAGIQLGQAVGAQSARLDKVDSSRMLLYPKGFVKGMLVNAKGERFIAEDAYTASIGHEISERQDGKAWLIVDRHMLGEAWRQVMPWRPMLIRYRLRSLMPLLFAWRRGRTLDELEAKCGLPGGSLARSLAQYNLAAREGRDALLDKHPANLQALADAPYYAINCATDSRGYPPTSFTLGGLVPDEDTGQVLDTQQRPIAGLYAAGRNAVGIPSEFYVSGLSIADCVFSGRRAGIHAARAGALSRQPASDTRAAT